MVVLAAGFAAAEARAGQVPIAGFALVLAFNADGRHMMQQLGDNCVPLDPEYPWTEDYAKVPYKRSYLVGASLLPSTGAYDSTTGRARLVSRGDAWRFESYLDHDRKALMLSDLGVELTRDRAYLTGVVRYRAATYASAPRRVRLAVVKRPKRLEGQAHYEDGEEIPNSWLYARQGRATVLPAFARVLERARCKRGHFVSEDTRRIRAGETLGQLTIQLRAEAAIGTGGTLDFASTPELTLDDEIPVTVAPAGGATGTGVAKGDRPALRFAMAPGARVPLVCDRGFSCTPVPGATFALDGGFTLAAAGRTVSVTGLAMSYTARDDGAVIATLTGAVDGIPMAIAVSTGSSAFTTEAFDAQAGAALGGALYGLLGKLTATFTAMTSA